MIKSLMLKKRILNVLAFILSGAFCLSAFTKLLYWIDTVVAIESLIFVAEVAPILTGAIILLEIALAVLILGSHYRKQAGIISSSIILFFTLVMMWGKFTGKITECPCFGKLFSAEIGTTLYIRNFFLIVSGLLLTFDN